MVQIGALELSNNETKDRILIESARLFALNGYSAVTIKEIARAVYLTPGSIYNHYPSKKAILDDIISKCSDILEIYYTRLDEANEHAQSLQEIVQNIFTQFEITSCPFTYYGFAIAFNKQFVFQNAKALLFDQIVVGGKERIKSQLDKAVERGLVNPFDTEVVAIIIIDCIMASNCLRIGEQEGIYTEIGYEERYRRVYKFIVNSIESIPAAVSAT